MKKTAIIFVACLAASQAAAQSQCFRPVQARAALTEASKTADGVVRFKMAASMNAAGIKKLHFDLITAGYMELKPVGSELDLVITAAGREALKLPDCP